VNRIGEDDAMRITSACLTIVAVLALSAVMTAVPAADAAPEVIGVGYAEYSPSGHYSLEIYYYSDATVEIIASYDGPESSSEMGKVVSVILCEDDHEDTRERTVIAASTPLRFDEHFRVEGLTESALEPGIYAVQVKTHDGMLVVESKLAVGISILTVDAPEEGTIEPSTGDFMVPTGTVLVAEDDTLTASFDDTTLHTFEATPPPNFDVDGWYVDDVKITGYTMHEDTEVEVKWVNTVFNYVLTYDANGGSGAPTKQTYTGPETSHTFTTSSASPTRSGYTFLGWSLSSTATSPSYQPGGSITLESASPEKTLYAVWKEDTPTPTTYTYTLTYKANGGSGEPPSQSRTTGFTSWTFTVSSGVPTREGYTFLGWADSSSATSPSYHAGSSITLTYASPSKTIYAVWSSSPIVPDVDDFYIEVDSIYIPAGKSWVIPCVIKPIEAAPGIVWESSDDDIATVSGGEVTAVSDGKVTITAYDRNGKELGSVAIEVVSSSERTVEEEIETSDGGSVEITYEFDDEGSMVLVNPITIYPGDLKRVTDDQTIIAWGYIETLRTSGVDPHVIIPTDEQSVGVPKELLEVIVDNDGSLTVIEGDVTLFFSAEVLRSIGYTDDLEFCVVPMEISGEGSDIDFPDLPNARIYDLYILSNGERVTRTFSSEVVVTMEYQLKDGQELSRLHVWYIDVDPIQAVDFKYIEGTGVQFGVLHFSHYAISYDDSVPIPCDHCFWCWILIAIAVILILFLIWFFLWKRFRLTLTNDGGTIVSVPEGWERESVSSISIRMRRRQAVVIPDIRAEPPSGSDGGMIIGWDPVPPERMTGSIELHLIWSNGPAERIGPSEEDRISDE